MQDAHRRRIDPMQFVAAFLILVLAAATSALAQPATSSDASPAPVLLSRQLATRAHVTVGDDVTLTADPNRPGRSFRVVGIYEPTPDPMRFTAQRLEARLHLTDLLALAWRLNPPPFVFQVLTDEPQLQL